MGLEQFLTENDKRASLEKLTKMLALDIYTLCLRAGIDPDTFSYVDYVVPTDGLIPSYTRELEARCKSLAAAEQKLAELDNA
jgi:hypothetical protein